ncbi:MAG: ribosome assembly factor SBDS [Aigarchaeota archaeon]|nr:ribosome assembly factor SBDS [Aigarchaeota archaeon]MCX8193630.1 ribosome assembly factor SBDS [Nitrososphaeria archaeon]MDW7987030.1 ribosome assembly factor SBDS [Nitrososphaerota archaeon]
MPVKTSYTIARIDRKGMTFEILIDPDKALKYKLGESIPLSKIVVYEEVYKDSRKGTKAGEEDLNKAFGTTDFFKIAEVILKEGTIQITAEQRRSLIEEKKKAIIDFISKNAIDPRTNLPHPPQRIELALEQAGVTIDPFQDAKEQAMKIIEKLRTILPLKIGIIKLQIRLPGDVVGRAYGLIKNMGKIIKEEWAKDGSWKSIVEAPTGLHLDLIDRLTKIAGGRIEVNLVEE